MMRVHDDILRALVATQVAFLEYLDADVNDPEAKARFLVVAQELVKRVKRLE